MPRAVRRAGWSRMPAPPSRRPSAPGRRTWCFTSGGTEANALALTPGLRRGAGEPVRAAAGLGHRACVGAVGRAVSGRRRSGPSRSPRSGLIDLDHLRRLLADGPPALVSVMLANNETGALQPVAEVADIVHEAGGLLHVDAIQALGKIPFDIKSMKADLLTLSAHKIGGPKGVGALVLAEERAGAGAAAAWRRAGAGPPGRHRECRRASRPSALPCRPPWPPWQDDAERLQGLRNRLESGPEANAGNDRVLRAMRRGCPIPRCSRFPG